MAYGEFSSTGPDDMLREHLANGLRFNLEAEGFHVSIERTALPRSDG